MLFRWSTHALCRARALERQLLTPSAGPLALPALGPESKTGWHGLTAPHTAAAAAARAACLHPDVPERLRGFVICSTDNLPAFMSLLGPDFSSCSHRALHWHSSSRNMSPPG